MFQVRTIVTETAFSIDELEELYVLFKVSHLVCFNPKLPLPVLPPCWKWSIDRKSSSLLVFLLNFTFMTECSHVSVWNWLFQTHTTITFYDILRFSPVCSSLQAEHLTSCYWGGSSNPTERHDPSLPYLEQYRIDMEQFKGLFNLLFPWANGAHSDPLAVRFFRLLDLNGDALINFREFISGLGE